MAGTSFIDIYALAISEVQDPNFKALFEDNVLLFSRAMNNFMENAIAWFSRPVEVRKKLAIANEPYDLDWSFVGDGVETTFTLVQPPNPDDVWNMVFRIRVDGKRADAEYDENLNAVVFLEAPIDGAKILVEAGYIGDFVGNLTVQERSLLSQWVMVGWSEYIQNNRMDIDRLLNDTDFRLTSAATATQAKSQWFIINRETVEKRMLQYAWESKILGTYK